VHAGHSPAVQASCYLAQWPSARTGPCGSPSHRARARRPYCGSPRGPVAASARAANPGSIPALARCRRRGSRASAPTAQPCRRRCLTRNKCHDSSVTVTDMTVLVEHGPQESTCTSKTALEKWPRSAFFPRVKGPCLTKTVMRATVTTKTKELQKRSGAKRESFRQFWKPRLSCASGSSFSAYSLRHAPHNLNSPQQLPLHLFVPGI